MFSRRVQSDRIGCISLRSGSIIAKACVYLVQELQNQNEL